MLLEYLTDDLYWDNLEVLNLTSNYRKFILERR